ncbi:MAG TPA: condensation domain-containing protein, partial [Streptosporangiaceae bacterium]|nr:condensation domain-containing protein [Streptosporangiaceae bacterium]
MTSAAGGQCVRDENPMANSSLAPLSFAQRRLWFLSRFEGEGISYNVPLAVRLRGQVDQAALKLALEDVADRHEALRTVFPEVGGVPWQQVHPGGKGEPRLEVAEVDQTRLPEAVASSVGYRFDLATELPVRAWLFVLSPLECVLVIVFHHIAADGWSLGPLGRDLGLAYEARCAGREPEWDPLPVQYADYALWQRELLGDEEDQASLAREQLEFWRGVLAGLPLELVLPFDRVRPAVASFRGGRVRFGVPGAVRGAL